MTSRWIRAVCVVALAVPVFAGDAAGASDDLKPRGHCVVEVTGQKPDGEMVLAPERCFTSVTAAEAAFDDSAHATSASSLLSMTIGTHCDLTGGAAPCTSVVGATCSGGWLNVSVAWDDRFSSTVHGCPNIRHYTGANLTGSSQLTSGGIGAIRNLGATLNNASTSIQYLP